MALLLAGTKVALRQVEENERSGWSPLGAGEHARPAGRWELCTVWRPRALFSQGFSTRCMVDSYCDVGRGQLGII